MTARWTLRAVVAAASWCLAAPGPAPAFDEKPAEKQRKQDDRDDRGKKDARDKKPDAPRAKSYTDDDLKKYSEERAATGESGSAGDTPLVQERSEPATTRDGEDRAVWADRAKAQRERIAEAEGSIVSIEARIAALRTDRDPSRVMEPFRLQAIEADIAKAMGELEAAKKELAAAREALEAVQQDARRRGVPEGWLREP